MSKTVWTVPWNVTDAQTAQIVAWCAEQGIDAYNAARTGFHITEERGGGLTAHYDEYLIREDGARTLDYTGEAYRKRPVRRPVTSLPNI